MHTSKQQYRCSRGSIESCGDSNEVRKYDNHGIESDNDFDANSGGDDAGGRGNGAGGRGDGACGSGAGAGGRGDGADGRGDGAGGRGDGAGGRGDGAGGRGDGAGGRGDGADAGGNYDLSDESDEDVGGCGDNVNNDNDEVDSKSSDPKEYGSSCEYDASGTFEDEHNVCSELSCESGSNNESDEEFAGDGECGSENNDDKLDDIDSHEVDTEADRDFSASIESLLMDDGSISSSMFEPFCPGAVVSICAAYCAIMSFAVKNKLSYASIEIF